MATMMAANRKDATMKTVHEVFIPAGNWTKHLADTIRNAKAGDTTRIVVHNHDERELGIRAQARMCPEKDIEFVIQEE